MKWLRGGNDRQTASTTYSGQESATERKARKEQAKTRKRRAQGVAEAARAGEAWEVEERRRTR
ncbi:hypothetical protein [Streptomyces sp. H27-H5]|uniref:hypothetical protein n=1 Tax=Streptomyces sp. H27-H5 TaxID=2996460 RepID=UPI00226FE7DC|nr:hypothetical protein [Streptomyces sp. H27-H5]MCY0957691.1 hypothetical protein [Streptomyces sp. H27-H5]